ncbi:UNVERIFIED_CONTAM: hypothetical protein Slati_0992000 [Sesamum latifolium]|uniref:Retrotransposon Copia-like N-terminal domain-containing protein n=1 Tax=Sesamum latifolium TaxID=2727402 RepID=A0AAW2XRM3_9LAMI
MTEIGESNRRVAVAETGEGSRQQMPKTLLLHGSDHPGMVLIGTLLTKNNYLTWSYAVKRALRAKMKFSFIEAHFYTSYSVKFLLWHKCTCGRCTCGVTKTIADQATFSKLIEFLMGLSETFDHMRDQLLVIDPVPSVNNAYSMILRVEKQREVHMEGNDTIESVAMQVRTGEKRDYFPKGGNQRKLFVDKKRLHCDNCGRVGHTRETCFKLHGSLTGTKS